MIVAIISAKWADVNSLETPLGFDEFEYLALFLWLCSSGSPLLGPASCLSTTYWRAATTEMLFVPARNRSGCRTAARLLKAGGRRVDKAAIHYYSSIAHEHA